MNGVIRIPEGRRAAPLGPRAPRQKTPAPATNEAQIRGEGGNKGKESVSDGVGHLRVAGDAELHQEARQGAEKRHFRGEELVLDHVEEALSMVATEGGQHGQLGERQNNTYDRSGTCTTITLAPNGAHVGCTAMFNAAPPLLLTPLGAGDRACQAGAKGGGDRRAHVKQIRGQHDDGPGGVGNTGTQRGLAADQRDGAFGWRHNVRQRVLGGDGVVATACVCSVRVGRRRRRRRGGYGRNGGGGRCHRRGGEHGGERRGLAGGAGVPHDEKHQHDDAQRRRGGQD